MKCRAYLHEKLNASEGVIRSRELSLATEEKIASALGKLIVTNIRRISIRKSKEWIQTNTYILTFNQPHTLRRWRSACREQQTCAKCGEKNWDHMGEDCLKEICCVNCRQDHLGYARSCVVYKKEKEIIEVKHQRNVSFLEARRIVGSYMGEISYTSVAWRVHKTNEDSKYRKLVEKLIQLEANDWPMFQEHLKKTTCGWILPSTSSATGWEWGEIQCCSPNKNTRRIQHELLLKVQNLQQNSRYISHQYVHQKALITDKTKKLVSHKQKLRAPIIQMNTKVNKQRPGSTFKMPSRTKSPLRMKVQCSGINKTPPKDL